MSSIISNDINANAIKLYRQVKRDRHMLQVGLTAEQQAEQATQIMRMAQIDAPGKEPKILIETTKEDGSKEYHVPRGCEFERFGALPYGWPVNPYDVTRYPMDNQGLARLFVDSTARGRIAYHAKEKAVMSYNGIKWVADDSNGSHMYLAQDDFIDALRHAADCIDDKDFKKLFEQARISAAISETGKRAMAAYAKAKLSVPAERWDVDPYALNLLNGVYHLDTMTFEPGHRPEDMMTQVANVAYDPEATSPLFEDFLRSIFDGDQDKIDFVVRWFGYSLLGANPQEKMVIAYGRTTRNGKGTLQSVISAMMGDYVGVASEKLIIKNNRVSDSTIQEYTAALTGKRFTSISELPRNSQLESNFIRQVTGGDDLRICRKYKDSEEISVYPHITCWTNYLPRTNDPMLFKSDRIMVLTFDHHFVDSMESKMTGKPVDLDPTLKPRIHDSKELPGVLNILLRGWQDYVSRGKLDPPDCVIDATYDYMAVDDTITQYMHDCYVETHNPSDIILASQHFDIFKRWAKENNYGDSSKSTYKKDMVDYLKTTRKGRDALVGYRVRTAADGEWVDPKRTPPDADDDPDQANTDTSGTDANQLTIGPAISYHRFDDDDDDDNLPF